MKKWIIILCLLILSSCASTRHNKDYNIRRNLMILENYELPRNKPLKYSKKKIKKQLWRKNQKYLRKQKRAKKSTQ
jgi:uncharacterized lipoprotein YmbA